MRAIGSRVFRFPRWTLRLRLTLLYGALFLAAGAILLTITYELVAHDTSVQSSRSVIVSTAKAGQVSAPTLPVLIPNGGGAVAKTKGGGVVAANGGAGLAKQGGGVVAFGKVPPGTAGRNAIVRLQDFRGQVETTIRRLTAAQAAKLRQVGRQADVQLNRQRSVQLDALVTRSGIALGIMAVLSIILGWLMAGRALRPVRTMSARARGISERNLHQRLGLEGPDDELKELGETFDGLLTRLEAAFDSQRRFVSNASHELRTPMTLSRTLLEVALADDAASVESLRDTCRRVLASGEQQERLVAALLTLARSQRGLDVREPLDLGAVASEVTRGVDHDGAALNLELEEAWTIGDPALVERLVANLLDNALSYNAEDGWVRLWTGVRDGEPTLSVENPGPVISSEESGVMTEPFRRLNGHRRADGGGLGLGLSIVQAIVVAHGGQLRTRPRPEGGLEVEVRFPVPATATV